MGSLQSILIHSELHVPADIDRAHQSVALRPFSESK